MPDLLYERVYQFLSDRQRRAVEAVEQFAVGSIVGSVRNQNEDVALIANIRHGRSPENDYRFALVCDGMGGMKYGRQAALIASSTFVSQLLRPNRFDSPSERLGSAIVATQREVLQALRGEGGTTLSAIYLDKSVKAWLAHVGDSRIYAIDKEGSLRQLSRDDTIAAALNREYDKRPEFNRLIQFVGTDADLEPQITSINRLDCNGFLLTSDGAHSAPYDILSSVARYAKSAQDLVRKLLSVADALGGLDNASAVHVPSASESATSVNSYSEGGILASILCVSGEHDIWITPSDAIGAEIMPPKAVPVRDERNDTRGHGESTVKSKGAKRRAQGKPKEQPRPRNELPPEIEKPIAKLDFSEDEEAKS